MKSREKDAQFKARARDLASRMTTEEKIFQMLYTAPALPRLGLPAYNWWNEALHGVARAGTATMFPQAIAMAASFDPDLLRRVADAISTEARAKFNEFQKHRDFDIYKGLTIWSPNVNIFRDPRWGRGHETYGEDPTLTGKLGAAFIRGLQGDDENYLKTAACAKHFAVHSGPEELRHEFDAQATLHDMFDTYLPAFYECVVEAGVEIVMGAYNRTNGEPCCASTTLLQDILRKRWGFDGHVTSDCWAVNDFHLHHKVTSTASESAALAVKNGCDLNCGTAFSHLLPAVEEGLVSDGDLEEAVTRLMTTRARLGLFEEEVPFSDIPYEAVDCPAHRQLNLEAARRSVTLLKNDGVLPLKREAVQTLGVIGPNAASITPLMGNYHGTASQYITVLDGLRMAAPDARILYAQGSHLALDRVENLSQEKGDRIAEALTVAEHSDAVVLCLGLDESMEGEENDPYAILPGGDKPDLLLPQPQRDLLEKVCSTGKPVILVMLVGSCMDLRYAHEHCAAIIQGWYPGSLGGQAIAEAIFGDFSPSGRLPVTFYRSTESLPAFTDYSMEGRTYRYLREEPLYPFGYGLSYTCFDYSGLEVREDGAAVTVKNTGSRDGWEIPQLYLRAEGKASAPHFALKGFAPVYLRAGEERAVSFPLARRDFALVDEEGTLALTPGEYTVFVGGQQPDGRSAQLTGRKCLSARIKFTETEVFPN